MKKLIFITTLVLAMSVIVIGPRGFRAAAVAAPVVIDFENVAGPLTNQFAALGVTFNQPTVLSYQQTPGFAHSGVKAIEQCFAQEFCSAPIDMSFTSAQRRVKVWAGLSSPFSVSSTVLLRVLDANGAQIGQATAVLPPSNSPRPINTPLEVALPNAVIRRALVSFFAPAGTATNSLAVDDVEFDSAGPPPPCPATLPPTLNILQPANGQTVQFNSFMFEAQVNSQDPLAVALTLTTVAVGGATRSSVLTLNNGKYGPIHFNDFLFPGLNTLTARFQDCKGTVQASRTITYAPIPAGTRFVVMGIEVTQATQDDHNGVPLVANKPAVARVYLRTQGPLGRNVTIRDVRGFLAAQHRSATGLGNFLPGNPRALNLITATGSTSLGTRRFNFNASVNFELPAAWTAAGDLHLSFRPDIKDSPTSPSNLPCTNCDNGNPLNPALPLFVKFAPTRPLNLILAPYVYQPRNEPPFPLSADLLLTPAGALQWVNNVYPLAGNFPSDGAGINLIRILPMRTTTRNMQTSDGKDDFLADLRDVFASLQSQGGLPSDVRLLGMVPCGCGGEANLNGHVGFVDTWAQENGPVAASRFEGYGDIWAHELGHNFGRSHAGNWHGEAGGGGFDANYPNFHGGIGQPGLALITEWWRAGGTPFFIAPGTASTTALGPHAHDFMSYGHLDPLNTGLWVSPYTYNALFDKFKLSASAALQADTLARHAAPDEQLAEKLVASGRINADGTVELQPFYRADTAFSSGGGDTGEFSLLLLDANDRVLAEQRFDAQAASHSDAGMKSFTEFVPWHADAARIVLKRGEVWLAERTVSTHAPTVRVLTPNGGELAGTQAFISWEASDADGDALTYTVLYNDGTDALWWPIATGVTANAITVDTSLWPGAALGRVKVSATDGVHSSEAVSDALSVPQKNPLVAILNSAAGQLTGVAYDPQEGLLPAARLTWTSDQDGQLEAGRQVRLEQLSNGTHVLTLTVTNSQGRTATAQVTQLVRRTPDK